MRDGERERAGWGCGVEEVEVETEAVEVAEPSLPTSTSTSKTLMHDAAVDFDHYYYYIDTKEGMVEIGVVVVV